VNVNVEDIVRNYFGEAKTRLQEILDQLRSEIDQKLRDAKRKAIEEYERL